MSTGTWKDPGACNQLLSAISGLHLARKQNGIYSEPCAECITEYENHRCACRFHVGNPRIWRTGCPREVVNVKNRYQKVTKIDLPDYEPQGNSPLLPHELLELRSALLSKNSLDTMRLWTMILFHIRLFLRSAEGCAFKFDHFLQGLTSVNPISNLVNAIGVKIKGKSDDSFKPFMIWRNDKVPELCLVRQLLAWISLIRDQDSDYIFPDGSGSSHVDYNTFNNQYDRVFLFEIVDDFC